MLSGTEEFVTRGVNDINYIDEIVVIGKHPESKPETTDDEYGGSGHIPTDGGILGEDGGGNNGWVDNNGGGGGSGGGSPSPGAIFDTDESDPVLLAKLAGMVGKIGLNCMGQALLNALEQNGGSIRFVFDSSMGSRGRFENILNNYTIRLGTEAQDHALLHEMMHVYQAKRGQPVTINSEIEAWVAQRKYNPVPFDDPAYERTTNSPRGQEIQKLEFLLGNRGENYLQVSSADWNRVFQGAVNAFRRVPPYNNTQNYPLDASRTGIANFSNIANLSAGC